MKRLGTPATTRTGRLVAMVTVAALAITTLGACVPGGETARSSSPELRLYDGPIPEPAPLEASGIGGAVQPVPPTDPFDADAWAEFEAEMADYLDALQSGSGDAVAFAARVTELAAATENSDEASIAAWQSLLVAAGIAVGHGDHAVNMSGMEGAGVPMSHAELRLHALIGASGASLKLVDVAHMLGGAGIFDETTLAQDLYDDLMASLGSDFGTVFLALAPGTFTTMHHGSPRTVPIEEVTLTAAQTALVLRRLARDLLEYVETNGGIDATLATLASAETPDADEPAIVPVAWNASAVDNPCGDSDPSSLRGDVRRNVSKGAGALFGELMDLGPGNLVKDVAKVSQALLAVASLLARLVLMQADFSMQDSPLVRTKNREPGERREVAVALKYPPLAHDDARGCLSAIFAAVGFDLSDHENGPAKGVDVDLVLRTDRLWFSTERGGTATYRQKTGDDGVATFPLLGKPQRERLPEGAEPDDVTARVRAEANAQGSDLAKDLESAAWDAIGRSAVGIVASILSRMQLIIFAWEVPVRDWKLVADFDVTLSGRLWGHSAVNTGGTSQAPCGTWVMNMSTTGEGTIESKGPTRVTAHYLTEHVEGEVISGLVFYPKGSSLDALVIGDDGGELAYLQVDYAATKSEAAPGVDPMPEHYQEPGIGGCGDGDGDYSPPQPDCGAREYGGLATLLVNDGRVRVLADEPSNDPWKNCGWSMPFADPLSPPGSIRACASAQETGGQVPSADSVFGTKGTFEITGSLNCSRDRDGSLERFTFDWTLTFCRVDDEGESAC